MNHKYEEPTYLFNKSASGLLLPVGLKLGEAVIALGAPSNDGPDPPPAIRRVMKHMPGYADLWDGPMPGEGELFADVPTQWWLEILSRMAIALTHQDVYEELLNTYILNYLQPAQRKRAVSYLNKHPDSVLISPFPVYLTLELAAALSRPSQPQELTIEGQDKIMRAIYAVWTLLNDPFLPKVLHDPSGVAAAMTERSHLETPWNYLTRGYGCWCWQHSSIQSAERAYRQQFDQVMCDTHGVTTRDWIRGLTMATSIPLIQSFKGASTRSCRVDLPIKTLSDQGNGLVTQVLSQVSSTLAEFQETCAEHHAKRSLVDHPSLLPLKRHPCIRVGYDPGSFIIASPVHLAEAAFERPVRVAESQDNSFGRKEFGLLVEAYVHELFRRLYGTRYQKLETSRNRKRCEGVIWYPNGAILVECKATRVAERIRYGLRTDDEYFAELGKGGLKHAVDQLTDTTDDICAGKIHPPHAAPLRVFGSLIVMYQEIPQAVLARPVLDKILPATRCVGRTLHLRPQIISVGGLESLDGWQHLDLLEQLAEKMRTDDATFDSLETFFADRQLRPRGRTAFRDVGRELQASMGDLFLDSGQT